MNALRCFVLGHSWRLLNKHFSDRWWYCVRCRAEQKTEAR